MVTIYLKAPQKWASSFIVKTLGKELGIALSLDGVLKGLVLENILQFLALPRPHVGIHKIYQILTKC